MSKMADLDIVLTDYKLSDAQKNCVVEIMADGTTTARKNTVTALENKLFIHGKGDGTYELMNVLKEALGLSDQVEENVGPVLPETTEYVVSPDRFNKDWAMWERELMGFEATIPWKNTDVWDGLTAEEIRKDMDTALPVGRKARRERARMVRKALSAV